MFTIYHLMGMTNVQGKNAGKFEQYQLAEIKHSRLAMLAFSGLVSFPFPSPVRVVGDSKGFDYVRLLDGLLL